MSGTHRAGTPVHVPARSIVHRLPAEAKVVGLVVFVAAVALTPQRALGVFAVDAAVLATVIAASRLPVGVVVRRLAVVAPFVAFALLIPFVAHGDRTEVLGLSVSVDGLWSVGDILAKAILGATATLIVSVTTPLPDLLAGLTRLKVPPLMVAIAAFMLRYLDVLLGQVHRMRDAMTARGHDPRWLWQARPMASSAGALFVRSYERGERVHHAMAARGYRGSMPDLRADVARNRDWIVALAPGGCAVAALTTALVVW
jgi:cobalt/nickel transport system permease protein